MRSARRSIDYLSLYEAIDAKRREYNLSWRQVNKQLTGSETSTITARLRQGRPVSADMVGLILMWTGRYDMRDFLLPFRAGRRYTVS